MESASTAHIYTVALRKLIDLQEFVAAETLFDEMRETARFSRLLCVPIYNTMIYLCVQRRSKYALKQGLELYSEMTTVRQLEPDVVTLTNLIMLCTAVAAWDKAGAQ